MRSAQTDEAIAAYDETVAAYRQQVLTAFQEVEDYLAAQAMLGDESDMQSAAVAAAIRSETITRNQYRAGVVSYLDLLVAENNRISAENTLWDIRKRQFTSSVGLIAAIGGQWDTSATDTPATGTATPPPTAPASQTTGSAAIPSNTTQPAEKAPAQQPATSTVPSAPAVPATPATPAATVPVRS